MRKFIGIGVFFLALTVVSTDLFAWSARRGVEWVKNPSKAATISSVDAAQYNPGGLTQLTDGLSLFLGNQMAIKTYTMKYWGTRDAVDQTPAFLNPNASMAYVQGNVALFATFDVIGGGGTLNYQRQEGLNFATLFKATLSSGKLSEAKTAISVGISYALFNEKLGLAVGVRYLMHDKTIQANANIGRVISASASLTGWAPFLGVNIQPSPMFNIGILFQPTARKRGNWTNHMTGITSDTFNAGNIAVGAASLGFTGVDDEVENGFVSVGIGIRPMEKLEIQISAMYHFDSFRKYGSYAALGTGGTGQLSENRWKNRMEYDIAIGFEYNMGLIRPSLGVNYNHTADTGVSNLQSPWDPGISSTSVGLGVSIVPSEMFRIDVGILKPFYAVSHFGAVTWKKDAWVFGFGVGIHI